MEIEGRRFFPTDTGRVVSRFLSKHFGKYVDYDFTAELEDELDAISRGEKEWVPLLDEFWGPFRHRVEDKMENVSKEEAVEERPLGTDPDSGRPRRHPTRPPTDRWCRLDTATTRRSRASRASRSTSG